MIKIHVPADANISMMYMYGTYIYSRAIEAIRANRSADLAKNILEEYSNNILTVL